MNVTLRAIDGADIAAKLGSAMNVIVTPTFWTDERVALLRKLWAEGLTGDQIAAELGGVTRNAVIGKIHRLGLSGRVFVAPTATPAPRPPRPAKAASAPSAKSVGKPVAEPISPRPVVVPEPIPDVEPADARCSILDLTEFTCRWPLGTVGRPGFAYCGSGTYGGGVYCRYHARIAYQPVEARERRREVAP